MTVDGDAGRVLLSADADGPGEPDGRLGTRRGPVLVGAGAAVAVVGAWWLRRTRR